MIGVTVSKLMLCPYTYATLLQQSPEAPDVLDWAWLWGTNAQEQARMSGSHKQRGTNLGKLKCLGRWTLPGFGQEQSADAAAVGGHGMEK